jgi:hypothetical protein
MDYPCPRLRALTFILCICLATALCLPGESDVAQRFNAINQRAQVETPG